MGSARCAYYQASWPPGRVPGLLPGVLA